VLGAAVVSGILSLSRDLPLSEREPPQLARLAALSLHRGSEAPFGGELTRALAASPGSAIPISVALEKICLSALFEMDDVAAALGAVALEGCACAAIAERLSGTMAVVVSEHSDLLGEPGFSTPWRRFYARSPRTRR